MFGVNLTYFVFRKTFKYIQYIISFVVKKNPMMLEQVDLPWNQILTACGQFSQGGHEHSDEAGGVTRGAG